MILKDISEVFSGHTFRERIENNPGGDCFVIQLKDLDLPNQKIKSLPHLMKSEGIYEKHFLQPGDILFIAKGSNNYALTFHEGYKAIAASVFFIIRTKSEKINPFYLSWYINQPPAQEYIHKGKEGTMVTNIGKNTLENLPVEVPSLDVQKKIAKLHELMQKEIFISEAILKKKKLFIEKGLLTTIK